MDHANTQRFAPKIWEVLPTYTWRRFSADLIAGATVGLVAFMLGIAFAIASGLPPQAGIYTAIVAGIVVSLLGGSCCQIAGPTGAFVVVIGGIIAQFGQAGLLMCTAMAGVILVVMGITGLGSAVRFIPRAVTSGFTNGIAVLIASTQIKDFFGLTVASSGNQFLPRMSAIVRGAHTVDFVAVGVSLATLAVIFSWPRITKGFPAAIAALFVVTAICALFSISVQTIGSQYGGIPLGLPRLSIPEFDPELVLPLLRPACTVAMLVAIQSLLSAVVADNLKGDRHRPDIELVAQGVANMASPMFGGMPAAGAVARTVTNIRSGASSPVAGIVHSLTLLVIVLVAAPLARFIPLASLAAILMVVAYRMADLNEIHSILRLSTADRVVWAATFLLTVFADLTVAVEVGMVLAALLFIHRVAETTTVASVTDEMLGDGEPRVLTDRYIPAYCSVIRIRGPFLFGATDKLDRATADISQFGAVVVLKMTYMPAIDGTGIHSIESLAKRVKESGRSLVLCGMPGQPTQMIERSKLMKLVGRQNIAPHLDAALERAAIIHGGFDDPRRGVLG